MSFLPFALPDIGEEEIAEVVAVLRSGWVTTGPKTRQFEEEFAAAIGGGIDAIAVNSATAGLHLTLEAAGIGPGDEVITTPYTFTATAEVIRYLGAHPVFADIDPETHNLLPEAVRRHIGPRTRAIVPVHFAGLACEMDEILDIARQHGLKVIEDAAHAFPARHKSGLIGSLESDATVFSFYATKTMTTGEGGMITTRNPALARRCRVMRLHGISRDAFDRYTSKGASWQYEVIAPGYKYNLTDVASALGVVQLRRLHKFHQRRLELARRYDAGFAGLPLRLPPRPQILSDHAWHLYAIGVQDTGVSRDAFVKRMFDLDIGCSVHFIPLHLQPYWRETYRLKPQDYPNALATYEGTVSLPIYTRMSDTDQDRVIEAVRMILKGQ